MKFSEINEEQWGELQPYLDTCLLPVTGLTAAEQPYEATEKLERLRDLMDLVEIPFKGRVVTYPACHYISDDEHFHVMLESWCRSLKASGFRFVIIATISETLPQGGDFADMWLRPNVNNCLPAPQDVAAAVRGMWSGQTT